MLLKIGPDLVGVLEGVELRKWLCLNLELIKWKRILYGLKLLVREGFLRGPIGARGWLFSRFFHDIWLGRRRYHEVPVDGGLPHDQRGWVLRDQLQAVNYFMY